jgi:hypothetical protein
VIWPPIGEILRYLVALLAFRFERGGLLAERPKSPQTRSFQPDAQGSLSAPLVRSVLFTMFLKAEYELAGLPNKRSA